MKSDDSLHMIQIAVIEHYIAYRYIEEEAINLLEINPTRAAKKYLGDPRLNFAKVEHTI